jgi:hypothetical protein
MKYQFRLNDKQEKEFEEWQQKIKEIHGKFGSNEFRFIPNGIGTSVFIKNSFVKEPLDLSHVEDW